MNLSNTTLADNVYSWNIGMKTFRYQVKFEANAKLIFSNVNGIIQVLNEGAINPECDYIFTTDIFKISFLDSMNQPFTNFNSLEIFLTEV